MDSGAGDLAGQQRGRRDQEPPRRGAPAGLQNGRGEGGRRGRPGTGSACRCEQGDGGGLGQGFRLATEGADRGPGAGERGGQRAEGPRTEAKQGVYTAWPRAVLLMEALQVTAEEGEGVRWRGTGRALSRRTWTSPGSPCGTGRPGGPQMTSPPSRLPLNRWPLSASVTNDGAEQGPGTPAVHVLLGDVTSAGLSLFFSQFVNLF